MDFFILVQVWPCVTFGSNTEVRPKRQALKSFSPFFDERRTEILISMCAFRYMHHDQIYRSRSRPVQIHVSCEFFGQNFVQIPTLVWKCQRFLKFRSNLDKIDLHSKCGQTDPFVGVWDQSKIYPMWRTSSDKIQTGFSWISSFTMIMTTVHIVQRNLPDHVMLRHYTISVLLKNTSEVTFHRGIYKSLTDWLPVREISVGTKIRVSSVRHDTSAFHPKIRLKFCLWSLFSTK